MKQLKHDLLTSKYTEVRHEEDFKFNAPHRFKVLSRKSLAEGEEAPVLADIHFQEGPIKENGVNGVCNEDLIAMVICRLEHFQKSEYACRDNAIAITKLEEALLWLRKRTIGRENRNVEGTSEV
ncbi:ABC transporter ATPase [Anaerovorax sp. IOR16]|uniref:ABC transporter ATPase n=1 Tax=Anaerovorax sp. IOR16 TaxID=2773458 RepID=UPI0019D0F68F|nr:ABC transporter ATPase [Anaerovorax sp. IOR16]